jgi:hypothetical protein
MDVLALEAVRVFDPDVHERLDPHLDSGLAAGATRPRRTPVPPSSLVCRAHRNGPSLVRATERARPGSRQSAGVARRRARALERECCDPRDLGARKPKPGRRGVGADVAVAERPPRCGLAFRRAGRSACDEETDATCRCVKRARVPRLDRAELLAGSAGTRCWPGQPRRAVAGLLAGGFSARWLRSPEACSSLPMTLGRNHSEPQWHAVGPDPGSAANGRPGYPSGKRQSQPSSISVSLRTTSSGRPTLGLRRGGVR